MEFIFLFTQLFIFIPSFSLGCLVKSAFCDNVKYSKNEIDQPKYLKKCIPEPWKPFFEELQKKKYLSKVSFLRHLASNLISKGIQLKDAIEPRMPLLFKALEPVNPRDVRVVILGQDPTPQKGKATGVAFHVKKPRFVPAVLHMFLEVAFEGFPVDLDEGNVMEWARQGVLLLNTALTCPHKPPKKADKKDMYKYGSHSEIWKDFTISLIRYIGGNTAGPSVWLLWGEEAKKFSPYINKKHLIIDGGHPSPMGIAKHGDSFFGGNYFNGANQFLSSNKRGIIDWSLSNSGLNSLKLIPKNWKDQLLDEKEEIERKLKNPLVITEKIRKELENRLKQINQQLQQLQCVPYEQLKYNYKEMIRKLLEKKQKVCSSLF